MFVIVGCLLTALVGSLITLYVVAPTATVEVLIIAVPFLFMAWAWWGIHGARRRILLCLSYHGPMSFWDIAWYTQLPRLVVWFVLLFEADATIETAMPFGDAQCITYLSGHPWHWKLSRNGKRYVARSEEKRPRRPQRKWVEHHSLSFQMFVVRGWLPG